MSFIHFAGFHGTIMTDTQLICRYRRLLRFVLSNCTWKDSKLTVGYRQPFDLLAQNVVELESRRRKEGVEKADFENWLPNLDSNQEPSD